MFESDERLWWQQKEHPALVPSVLHQNNSAVLLVKGLYVCGRFGTRHCTIQSEKTDSVVLITKCHNSTNKILWLQCYQHCREPYYHCLGNKVKYPSLLDLYFILKKIIRLKTSYYIISFSKIVQLVPYNKKICRCSSGNSDPKHNISSVHSTSNILIELYSIINC